MTDTEIILICIAGFLFGFGVLGPLIDWLWNR